MLSIDFIRENLDLVQKSCLRRGVNFETDHFLSLDSRRRSSIQKVESLRQERNQLSAEKDNSAEKISKGKELKLRIREEESTLGEVELAILSLIKELPNILLPEVPSGHDDSDNVILRQQGSLPEFKFNPKSYLELGEDLDLIDIPRATKMAGSRFSYLKNELVLMQIALLGLAFEVAQEFDFQPILPPVMIKPELMDSLGYSSLAENNIYLIEKDNLNLVGTSEQSIAVMHQGEKLSNLPKRYIGYSTCFRREAGTYGRDLKGILRVHQFDKAELFSFCQAEKSQEEHALVVSIQEKMMQSLGLPYRVMALYDGDLAKPSAMTIDIESWLPSESRYLETHSSSNCTDYQARGLNVSYQDGSQLAYVHTINGTAFAMSRLLAVIMENYQQEDGSILIPEILQPRLNLKRISR